MTAWATAFRAGSLILGLAVAGAIAQTPAFTVASVKPSPPGERRMFASPMPGGGFSARNANVFYLLNMAYGLPANRILGGPDWMNSEYFDVEAKYEPADATAPAPRMQLMLQTLLRERFSLDAAMEKRDRPVYALRLVRADGRPGPGLEPAAFDCANLQAAAKLRESGARAKNGGPTCGIRNTSGSLLAGGTRLAVLGGFLGLDRPLEDQTGLTGLFDITMTWPVTGDRLADQSALFTALQEQLGLKLDAATAPLDVLVIKSIQRPTAN
jgi:uncharacterized protein (TIGR03435 family)